LKRAGFIRSSKQTQATTDRHTFAEAHAATSCAFDDERSRMRENMPRTFRALRAFLIARCYQKRWKKHWKLGAAPMDDPNNIKKKL
jgi:predicted metal-dependent TIM-barrel fold hydrolase